MNRKICRYIAAFLMGMAILAGGAAIVVVNSLPETAKWLRVDATTLIGGNSGVGRVYMQNPGPERYMLLTGEAGCFVVEPKKKAVLTGSRSNFLVFDSFAIDLHRDYGVDFKSPKMDYDPHLILSDKGFQFVEPGLGKIYVAWK